MKHCHCLFTSQEPYGPDPKREYLTNGPRIDMDDLVNGVNPPEHQTFIVHEHKHGEVRHRHLSSTPVSEPGGWVISRPDAKD